MSERGSFVTAYIYCDACFAAAKTVLIDNRKSLCTIAIPSWENEGNELPIIAGKIGASYAGEELEIFEVYYIPELAPLLCHPLRIAVLAEQGERIYTVCPGKGRTEQEIDTL